MLILRVVRMWLLLQKEFVPAVQVLLETTDSTVTQTTIVLYCSVL